MTNSTVPGKKLASALVPHSYRASFGRGNSQVAGQVELYYDPATEAFLIRRKSELLTGSWRSEWFPCELGQTRALLCRLPTITTEGTMFAHDGWLCRLDLEISRSGPELTMQFYTGGKSRRLELSSHLTARLKQVADGPHWLPFVNVLGS